MKQAPAGENWRGLFYAGIVRHPLQIHQMKTGLTFSIMYYITSYIILHTKRIAMVDDIVRRKGYLTLGSRMRRIGEKLQAEVQQLMDEQDMPIQANQYPLLTALYENGPLPVGDLAEALGVSQPGVTRNVGQLAKQGIVSVQRGAKDQRKTVVALTDPGRSLVESGQKDVWPKIETCLADILSGQSGPLLEQLDSLEDALKEMSFAHRIAKTDGSKGNG